jgi:hypothetical protein
VKVKKIYAFSCFSSLSSDWDPQIFSFWQLSSTSILNVPKKRQQFIVPPELQRFYGRAIVIITPVEMPISDINRLLSIIIFVLYLSVYRVVLGRIYD